MSVDLFSTTYRVLVLFALFPLGTLMSQANLGNTEAECQAKYGAESEVRDNLGFDVVGDRSAAFKIKIDRGSFLLTVVFLNGHAVHESIVSQDGAAGFSPAQEQATLNSENAGLHWKKTGALSQTDRQDNTAGLESWVRDDGAIAQCWTSGRQGVQQTSQIEFSTREYASAQGKLDKEDRG